MTVSGATEFFNQGSRMRIWELGERGKFILGGSLQFLLKSMMLSFCLKGILRHKTSWWVSEKAHWCTNVSLKNTFLFIFFLVFIDLYSSLKLYNFPIIFLVMEPLHMNFFHYMWIYIWISSAENVWSKIVLGNATMLKREIWNMIVHFSMSWNVHPLQF